MITYVFAIDPYNKIIEEDGQIYSETDAWGYLKSMGWIIDPDVWDDEKNTLRRKRLAHVFSQRNFFLYEQRLRYYEELRDGIFPI